MRTLNPLLKNWTSPRSALSPSILVGDVFEDFDRMVDGLMRPAYSSASTGFLPACDIAETQDHYLVSFDVPGLRKEEIKIEVKGNVLSISGERHRETVSERAIRHERQYGTFERTFELPLSIDAARIEALYENGVLNIALPKAEAEKSRTVQIQSGDAGLLKKVLGAKKEMKDVKVS